MSDTARMYELLLEAGPRGIHTFDLRRMGFGNPSQRANEAEKDYGFKIERPKEKRNGRWGSRFWLNVGSSTEGRDQAEPGGSYQPVDAALGVASGVAASSSSLVPASEAPPVNPYEYEVMEDAA